MAAGMVQATRPPPLHLPPPVRRRGTTWLVAALPPVATFLSVEGLLWVTARKAKQPFFHPLTWAHKDSGLYLWIATKGYVYFRCRYPTGRCGDAGWFPGYPALVRVGMAMGIHPLTGGLIISTAAFAGILAVIWVGFLQSRLTVTNLACLSAAALWFGQVYYHSFYPLALTALFYLCSIRLALNGRWLAGGLFAGLAATTYSTAVLLAPVAVLWIASQYRVQWTERIRRIMLFCAPIVASYCLVMLVIRLYTGAWLAFFNIQRNYGYGSIHNPVYVWLHRTSPFLHHGWTTLSSAKAFQAVAVAVTVGALVCAVPFSWRKYEDLDWLLTIFAVIFWVAPLTVGVAVDIYRSDALMLPVVLLVFRRIPRAGWPLLIAAELVAAYGTTALFVKNFLQ